MGAPAVLVCVFLPNGVAFHSGTRATVSRGRFDDIDKVRLNHLCAFLFQLFFFLTPPFPLPKQLLAHLSQHLKLPFGRPRRIYALPSGRRIRSIPALLSSGATHFSVATDEPFIECEYLNSRDLKPPTAGVARVWEEKEGGEDRSRSAPGYIQRHGARVSNEENSAEAKQGKKEVEKEKKRAPAKPVLSFMETLEMSKSELATIGSLFPPISLPVPFTHQNSSNANANSPSDPPHKEPPTPSSSNETENLVRYPTRNRARASWTCLSRLAGEGRGRGLVLGVGLRGVGVERGRKRRRRGGRGRRAKGQGIRKMGRLERTPIGMPIARSERST